MNEPLMHATIALAARCAESDPPPSPDEARAIARDVALARKLDHRDLDVLLDAADRFAAPVDEPAAPTTTLDGLAAVVLPRGGVPRRTPGPQRAEPATGTASPVGDRIGQYEVIRMLGEGGMGRVFLARDLRRGGRVAIKLLHCDLPQATQRFLVEARLAARCRHDNIAAIHEVGVHDGAPYIVLEYLDGKPLAELIASARRLPYTHAVEIMCEVLRALTYAHEQGIVHRDLTPDNVFAIGSGAIKVLDFGIARTGHRQDIPPDRSPGRYVAGTMQLASDDPARTMVGIAAGTPQYMSAEQWMGAAIDHRTDLWACGILLYRMIGGRHPLHPLDGSQLVVTAMLDLPMPSLAEAAPDDVPPELILIVDRCLRKAPDERWQSAGELLSALEPFLPRRRARTLPPDENPYAGLSAFQECDDIKFFGRDREIAAVVARLEDHPLVAVVGGAHVGKSSLVRAGVIPALKRSGEAWEALVVRPGSKPLDALARMIAPMVATAANLTEELDEHGRRVELLRREPGYLAHVLRSCARRDDRRILVFVDQLEELYTRVADPAERAAFTACLSAVADDPASPLRVVVSIRSDVLDRTAEDPPFVGALTSGLVVLGPPGRDGLRDAITRPAELAGFQLERSVMVEDMLDHVESTPGALPLLQFTATRLWENRDAARRMLTHQSYTAMGGVAGALARHADRFVAGFGPRKAVLVRAMLLRLVTAERSRALVPLAELRELSREAGEVEQLLDQMVDARLLVVHPDEDGEAATVELAHESLIHGWPALQCWLDEAKQDAALAGELEVAARQWQHQGHGADLLWRGDRAAKAGVFRARYQGPLSDIERGFLDASIGLAHAQARRRRAVTITCITALSSLVAAIALLAFAQASRVELRDSLEQARIESSQAARSLAELQRQEQERARAERVARAARGREELYRANQQLLEERNAAVEQANEARRAQLRAEDNERVARQALEDALVARAAAERAVRQLTEVLGREQQRIEELTKAIGGTSALPTLKSFTPPAVRGRPEAPRGEEPRGKDPP